MSTTKSFLQRNLLLYILKYTCKIDFYFSKKYNFDKCHTKDQRRAAVADNDKSAISWTYLYDKSANATLFLDVGGWEIRKKVHFTAWYQTSSCSFFYCFTCNTRMITTRRCDSSALFNFLMAKTLFSLFSNKKVKLKQYCKNFLMRSCA